MPAPIIDSDHLPEWVRVANCAFCGTVCVSRQELDRLAKLKRQSIRVTRLPKLVGHVKDRPCCETCAALSAVRLQPGNRHYVPEWKD